MSDENTVPMATQVRSSAISSGTEVYGKVVRSALYTAAFLMPLFFLPWTTGVLEINKQLLLAVTAGIGLMAWLLGVVMSGHIRLRPTFMDTAIGGLFISTFVATLFSMATSKSVFGFSAATSASLVSVAALSILYFLVAYIADDRGVRLKNALAVGTVISLFLMLLQVVTVYVLPFAFARSRAFNLVGSVNAAGVLAAVMLPLLLKTRLSLRGVPRFSVAKIGAVLTIAILIILNWWVLWLIASVGMLALIGLDSVAGALTRGAGGRWSMSRFILPITVIVLAVFLLIVNFNVPVIKDNLPVELAPSARLSLSIAKNVLATSTLTGYGPENFYLAFDKFGAKALANSTLLNLRFFDAMSEAMNRIVQEGILGVLAVLGLLWVVVRSLLQFKSVVAGGKNTDHTVGVYASVVAAMVAFFFYPFSATLSFVFYMLLALCALLLPSRAEKSVNIEDKPAFSLASSLGFVVGLIAVLTGWYFIGATYAADAIFAKASQNPDLKKAVDGMVLATNLNPKEDQYYQALSQATLGLLNEEVTKGTRNDPDRALRIQNYIQSAVSFAQRATELAPRETNNWFNLGLVYQNLIGFVDGVERPSEEAYRKAETLRPGDPSFANRIGVMYLGRAELDRQLANAGGANAAAFRTNAATNLTRAEDEFKRAIELSSNFGLAIYNLGAVYDRQGKTSEAIRQLEKIIPANANQPGLLFELGLLYHRVNRKDDAFAALQRAVLLSPQFANARWYLALIYEERKDLNGAIEQLEKILETNSDNKTVLDKIAQLKAGRSRIPPERVIDQKPL